MRKKKIIIGKIKTKNGDFHSCAWIWSNVWAVDNNFDVVVGHKITQLMSYLKILKKIAS